MSRPSSSRGVSYGRDGCGGEFVISVASLSTSVGERKRFLRTGDLAMRMPSTGLARIAPARIAVPQICESTLRCLEIEAAESPRSDCWPIQTATS